MAGPPEPRLGGAFREALRDFYFNSWRLAPANLAWAAGLVIILLAALAWPPAAVLVGALGIPVAGIYRMAARTARGLGTSFSDFLGGMRAFALPALTVGFGATILAVVFAVNVAVGLQLSNPLGWFLAATAAYAEVALAMVLVAAWPILVDPERDGVSFGRKLSLAALVIVARPGRILVLTFALLAILAAGVVILAGIALVGVAYAALVSSRYVLPVADRLDRRTVEVPD
jgi:hypothetical protein